MLCLYAAVSLQAAPPLRIALLWLTQLFNTSSCLVSAGNCCGSGRPCYRTTQCWACSRQACRPAIARAWLLWPPCRWCNVCSATWHMPGLWCWTPPQRLWRPAAAPQVGSAPQTSSRLETASSCLALQEVPRRQQLASWQCDRPVGFPCLPFSLPSTMLLIMSGLAHGVQIWYLMSANVCCVPAICGAVFCTPMPHSPSVSKLIPHLQSC